MNFYTAKLLSFLLFLSLQASTITIITSPNEIAVNNALNEINDNNLIEYFCDALTHDISELFKKCIFFISPILQNQKNNENLALNTQEILFFIHEISKKNIIKKEFAIELVTTIIHGALSKYNANNDFLIDNENTANALMILEVLEIELNTKEAIKIINNIISKHTRSLMNNNIYDCSYTATTYAIIKEIVTKSFNDHTIVEKIYNLLTETILKEIESVIKKEKKRK